MALLKHLEKLPLTATLDDLQKSIGKRGFKKVNNIMKSLGLNPRGLKSQDIYEVTEAIKNGNITLEQGIEAYNAEIDSMNGNREKWKSIDKESIEDAFDNAWDWISFAIEIGKQFFK